MRLRFALGLALLALTLPAAAQQKYLRNSGDWDAVKAAHLLRRAGFGGTPAEVQQLAAAGRDAAVDQVMNYELLPDDVEQRLAYLNLDLTRPGQPLQIWWLFRLAETSRPFQEKMILFWHDHFATGISKVRQPSYMIQQNQFLRRYALANFRTILMGISQDPAMMVWLDTVLNHRGRPNENYAREVMELFTVGIGNYTEQDIKEAARAFTGWSLVNGQFFFNSRDHDIGNKTFFGQTRNFNGNDIVDVLVARPATGRYLGRKLWEFFAYPNPEPELVEELAQVYLGSGYSIRAVMSAILRSDAFYSPNAIGALVKSPAEVVTFVLRQFPYFRDQRLLGQVVGDMQRMGQVLFNPPSVAGWRWGLEWINTGSVLARSNFVNRVLTLRTQPATGPAIAESLRNAGVTTPGQIVDYYAARFLPLPLTASKRQTLIDFLQTEDNGQPFKFDLNGASADSRVRQLMFLLLADATFQLN